ncbi:hypothetical protein EON64_01690 [archaeon]|nr:MAG: hypothetical protein EON64_01690 [archaeon]
MVLMFEQALLSIASCLQLSSKKSRPSRFKNSHAIQISDSGKVKLRVPFSKPTTGADGRTLLSSSLPQLAPAIAQSPAIHRPSGEMSVVSEASVSSPDVRRRKYTIREGNSTLWGAGGDSTLEAVERQIEEENLALQRRREREMEEERLAQQLRDQQEEQVREESDLDFLARIHQLNMDSDGNDSQASGFALGLRDSLTRLAASQAREKLKNLAKYISGHTTRKVLSCWNMIESRFKQSQSHKAIMVADSQGLFHPVQHKALFVSALVKILCSSRVRVSHGELTVLLDRMGIEEKEVLLGLKIAALNVVIQVRSMHSN